MTSQEKFIETIGAKATKNYQKTEILASITTAQACLESGYGTTELARNANNLFGMKANLSGNTWKSIWTGLKYTILTNEEYKIGEITKIIADFRKYPSLDDSIEDHSLYLIGAKNGNKLRYAGLTTERDYKRAALIIKDGGYATDSAYVSKLCKLIEQYNLTKFDTKGVVKTMGYTNSSLVNCTVKSPNHSGQRTHIIDRITPHCVVGQLTAESIGGCFTNPSREASCNYGIGKDGRVCLIVDEANRSWCTSSNANDQRAITIECASDSTSPYAFNNAVYNKLVDLCVDICKRNGKNKLIWYSDKNTALNYSPKSNEMLLTVHRWFANKSCPGNWMFARMGNLATEVTNRLGGSVETPAPIPQTSQPVAQNTSFPQCPFYATVLVDDLNIRTLPTTNSKVRSQTGKGKFTIVEVQGEWGRLKSGAGWIYLTNKSWVTITGGNIAPAANTIKLPYLVKVTTDALNIRKGPSTAYSVVGCIRDYGTYTIIAEQNGWGKLKSGAGWISLSYTKRV